MNTDARKTNLTKMWNVEMYTQSNIFGLFAMLLPLDLKFALQCTYTASSMTLLLLLALQLHMLKVLAFSNTSVHLPRSWTQTVQFFIFILQMSCLTLSSQLLLGLPCNRIVIGFHLYIFLTILSSEILCTYPNQLNLWALIWLIILLCFI
jgi:hypothetical protein